MLTGTTLDRFLSRFTALDDEDGGHWIWEGSITNMGYGSFGIGRQAYPAHRVSYEHFVGPIPEGKHIDHLCRRRDCVNPDHMEPVTPSENIRRGRLAEVTRARCAAITHCPHGHEYTPENTIRRGDGKRRCRQCEAAHQRRRRG